MGRGWIKNPGRCNFRIPWAHLSSLPSYIHKRETHFRKMKQPVTVVFYFKLLGASRLRILEENKLIVLGLRVGTTPQLTHLTSITPVRGGQGLATRGSDGFFGSYVASRGR